jgi:biopolymer transport protein ExbD
MARGKSRENTPGEPPMTPMIDVIFQLLIFLMVTLRFSTQEGRILSQLPHIGFSQGDWAAPEPEVSIVLCADGSDGEPRKHLQDKGAHDRASNTNLSTRRTTLLVERTPVGVAVPGVVNALQRRRIAKIEYEANPRLSRYLQAR